MKASSYGCASAKPSQVWELNPKMANRKFDQTTSLDPTSSSTPPVLWAAAIGRDFRCSEATDRSTLKSSMTLLATRWLAHLSIETQSDGGKTDAAKSVGAAVAKRALEQGVDKVVFDRGGYQYHGRVKALADAARAEGLNF